MNRNMRSDAEQAMVLKGTSCPGSCRRLILDFFKNPKKADNEVYAVNGKPNPYQENKSELIVA
jgi:hypothetical protein